ncbi:acyl-CoA dehydrogenase family protein (plasmid) [Sphingobium sp. JS3065]|uniref:acyl-CoA dehydrogenase family protein n=1 Tax=Sphingobium sp. JS3065 TaxID=2970925 RepID=UPI002264474A|nr:acyl-CoA dehydrogenase family protein [Sphingobium sp. JS3065]UZW58270.1 acyl-CoA dehydrogenase family protein [Sphingobium sp. JS3065]
MAGVFDTPAGWMDEELAIFEDSVTRFLADRMPASRAAKWRADGEVELDAWREAAQAGLIGLSIAPEFGGAGGDFRHEAVLIRRLGLAGLDGWGLPLHNVIIGGYIQNYGSAEQKRRWLPGIVSGETIGAIAMTEPGTGSDLQGIRTTARRSGNGYAIDGQKTFITNGQQADLIITVAKTDPNAGSKGISLIVVEAAGADGFTRGRNLDKIGMEMGDTSELHFDGVQVPADNVLGGSEGLGMAQLMKELPKERLMIAIESMAIIEAAMNVTLDYVRERSAFGKRILDFQNTQFTLAECKTDAVIGRLFVDDCIAKLASGSLDAMTASMAKYWTSERAQTIVDRCQQFFGGYGYMDEYRIAQLYKDVRVKRIYGGTTEIMKLLIARTLDN